MEARTGDGPKESPVDRRMPLRVVQFNSPTSVPGVGQLILTVEVGVTRYDNGSPWVAPQAFYDPALRMVVIEGRLYPLERVHYMERAKMAISKTPAPEPQPDYTVGKFKRTK